MTAIDLPDVGPRDLWGAKLNTAVETVAADVVAESAARGAADSALQAAVDAESAGRAAADTALADDLNDESIARGAADAAEATARAAAIAAETTARNAALALKAPLASPALTGTPTVNGAVIEDRTHAAGAYPSKAALGYADAKVAGYSPGNNNGAGTTTTGQSSGANNRVPFRVTVPTTRWRIHFRNYNTRLNRTQTGVVTVSGWWLGRAARSADGATYTGAFTATPTQVLQGYATNTDGSEYVSEWVTDPAQQLTPNVDLMLSFGYTMTSPTVAEQCEGMSYYGSGSAGASSATAPANLYGRHFFDWWIEYEYAGANPLGLFVGDSIVDGYMDAPVQATHAITSYPQQHAFGSQSVALVIAMGGSTAAEWSVGTDFRWSKWGIGSTIVPDYAIVHIGTNDINAGTTAATLIGYLQAIYTKLTALGVTRIFAGTITPRNAATAAQRQQMDIVNAWLLTVPAGVTGVIDFASAVRAPTVPAVSTTLSASSAVGATSISTVASIPAGTSIQIDRDGKTEYALTGTPTGSGPYSIPISNPATLAFAHSSGAVVYTTEATIDYRLDVSGLHFNPRGNALLAKALPARLKAV